MTLTTRAAVAYLTLCVAWGSTYLAIRIGVQHTPPALFGAIRFVAAGALMLLIARGMGRSLPRHRADWWTNAVVGMFLLTGANGLVIWAEQFVPSGVASIFVVTVTLWLAVFDAVIPGSRARPTAIQFVGLVAGFAGTVLLVGEDLDALREADWRGPLALTSAAILWALGSIYSQRRGLRSGPYVNSGIQMLAGGTGLLLIGTGAGEWTRLQFSWPGFAAIAYLTVVGSLLGFTAYVYVLRHVAATVAGTYAYVNAVVAVFLGWTVLSEPVTLRTIVSMTVVIASVIWVKATARPTGGSGSTPPSASADQGPATVPRPAEPAPVDEHRTRVGRAEI